MEIPCDLGTRLLVKTPDAPCIYAVPVNWGDARGVGLWGVRPSWQSQTRRRVWEMAVPSVRPGSPMDSYGSPMILYTTECFGDQLSPVSSSERLLPWSPTPTGLQVRDGEESG